YENGEGRELPVAEAEGETTTSVTTDFAPKAVFDAQGKIVVVDPCSFTRPGGAYEDGSFGPEQILCAESNLYPALRSCKELYHDKNRGYSCGMLFTDRALYLPDVAFVRDGTIRRADVLAIPEPIRTRALENHRSERECEHTLADRIEALLRIAAANGAETLVVGAFGCGPQGFAPELPISLFKAWIEAHPGAIAHITFAVPRASFDAFDAAFGEKKTPEPEVVPTAVADEDAEDDFDFDPADLPEGVTLRA
ncbi:MAG: TIGR02452 family protein, partial [Ellagibacter isourolithinifaciens]|nr:TIGR02452 family protein [Ellagibacter isourolithinifaciens]